MRVFGSFQKSIKALGSLGIGALAAIAQTHLPSVGLVMPVAGAMASALAQIFTQFGLEITSDLSADVIERFGKEPRELNHHLNQLFSKAIQQAIDEGLPISYEKETGHRLNKEFKKKLRDLGNEFNLAFLGKPVSSLELISVLDESYYSENYHSDLFSNRISAEYSPANFFNHNEFPSGFIQYFERNLLPIARILFIEGLKSKNFDKARTAYEQMMAEETYKSLNGIKKEIAELKAGGSLTKSNYALIPEKEFSVALEKISSPQQLQSLFATGFNQYFQNFDQKLDELLEMERDTNIKVSRIDVKTDKIHTGVKRGLLLSYFLVIVAIAAIALAYIYYQRKTFNATIELRDENNNAISNGIVAISYGIKKEKVNVNPDGMAMFTQIPSDFEDESVEILLLDELGKKYSLDSGSTKIKLIQDKIIHVKVIQKKIDSLVLTNRKIVNNHLTSNSSLGKKSKNDAETNDNMVKKDAEPSDNISGLSNMPNATANELQGVTYSESTSEDQLTFSVIKGSILTFAGKAGMYQISGRMKLYGKNLLVIGGNVTGSLTLLDNNNLIKGSFTINSSKAVRPIEMRKN